MSKNRECIRIIANVENNKWYRLSLNDLGCETDVETNVLLMEYKCDLPIGLFYRCSLINRG